MKVWFFSFFIVLFCCFGCGITGYYGSDLPKTSEDEKKARQFSRSFIGKTSEEVLRVYGEYRAINYDVRQNDKQLNSSEAYTLYDEVWSYKYEAGVPLFWPDQYVIRFYFIDGIVKKVSG